MKKITVSVKQWDIDHGEQDSADGCPIALALQRKYPQAEVYVFKRRVELTCGDIFVRRHIPAEAKNFIHEFDKADLAQSGDAFEPFEFQMHGLKKERG